MRAKYRYPKKDYATGETRCRCGQWFFPKGYETMCEDCRLEAELALDEKLLREATE